jgi:hypothetical protein
VSVVGYKVGGGGRCVGSAAEHLQHVRARDTQIHVAPHEHHLSDLKFGVVQRHRIAQYS